MRENNIAMKYGISLLLLALILAGCFNAIDFKEFNFTHSKPKRENLIGVWRPDKATLDDIHKRGHYPDAKYEIILREDGTFSLRNIPDWWTFEQFGESGGKFVSFDGRWDLTAYSGPWEISLVTTNNEGYSVNVYRQKPPYSLFLRLGDPNDGDAMIFDRVMKQN